MQEGHETANEKNKPWNALLLLLIAWTLLCCCYCGWMKGLSSARKVELGCWETRMTLTLITHHAIKDMILSLNLLSRRYPIANTLSRSYIEPWDNFYFHIKYHSQTPIFCFAFIYSYYLFRFCFLNSVLVPWKIIIGWWRLCNARASCVSGEPTKFEWSENNTVWSWGEQLYMHIDRGDTVSSTQLKWFSNDLHMDFRMCVRIYYIKRLNTTAIIHSYTPILVHVKRWDHCFNCTVQYCHIIQRFFAL